MKWSILSVRAMLILPATVSLAMNPAQPGTRREYNATVPVAFPQPVVTTLPDGSSRVDVTGCALTQAPGDPQLPVCSGTIVVQPGIDWSTFRVEVEEEVSELLTGTYSVVPGPPMVTTIAEDGGLRRVEYWGVGRHIAAGRDILVYGRDAEVPGGLLEVLPSARQRNLDVAPVLLHPVQYNPVRGTLRAVTSAALRVSYIYDSAQGPAVVDRAAHPAPVPGLLRTPMPGDVAPAAGTQRDPTYNYVIITSNPIATGSTKLDDYISHKTAQGYTTLVKTVESIESQYTRTLRPELFETTDERADRIKAFLKDMYLTYGLEYVMLVGNPDPDDPTAGADSVGNVPMKFCYPDNHYGTKYAPTDRFYADLTGQWDSNANGLFGEDADKDAIDLGYPELVVARIPYYSSNLAGLDSMFQKIIDYEAAGVDDSWKRKCFMPNPIDYSDGYGREGNMSPIWMAEWIKDQVLVPAGFAYFRLYEHNYAYPPHNVSPAPERIPAPLGYTCFSRYDSSHYFKAGLNVATDTATDYTISTMTDGSNTTFWTASAFSAGSFLQFRSMSQDDTWPYAPYKIVIRSSSAANLPQQFTISMASTADFGDGYTVVTETSGSAHAVQNGSYWELTYVAPGSLNTVGSRRFLRLTATGTQSPVQINEFLAYTEEARTIQPYVIPEWLNRYGVVYYNTHGWSTGASDIITSAECSQLDNAHPSFIFSKACSTCYPEAADNLCASFMYNGGIGVIGASRVSYGWGDMGYQLIMPRLVNQNKRFGVVYGEACAEAARANWYGWGGYFEDAIRFNLYGDPTVTLLTDRDADGLPYWQEEAAGSNPNDPDSDDDGLGDADEVLVYHTDPADADTDDDGLSDPAEIQQYGTNPTNPDTDDDGMDDGWEVHYALNPLVDDAAQDLDNDGFDNLAEFIGASHPGKPWSIPGLATPTAALDFDGANDFAHLGNAAVTAGQLTVEAWLQPQAVASARVLDKLEDYGLQLTGGNLFRFVTKHGFTWDNLDGPTVNPVGEWVHVAGVLDGAAKLIYRNGQVEAQRNYTYGPKVTSNPLIAGADSPNAAQSFFNGAVDEVRVWNVARTPEQINAGMHQTYPGSEPGLVASWSFDEGSGQVVHDGTGVLDGRLGSTPDPDGADPAWISTTDPAVIGPHIDAVDFPVFTGARGRTEVTAVVSDAGWGDEGVAAAVLYYGFSWPYNAYSVAGSGPGGNGDGTWTFALPAVGDEHAGQSLHFFLRADDGAGHPSFATNSEELFAFDVHAPGDWDGNGVVDLLDFAEYPSCHWGAGGHPGAGCAVFDGDADGDVDLQDFATFQVLFGESR